MHVSATIYVQFLTYSLVTVESHKVPGPASNLVKRSKTMFTYIEKNYF